MLYIGADISKDKVSVAFARKGQILLSKEFAISTEDLNLIRLTIKQTGERKLTVFLEQTGIYSFPVIWFFWELRGEGYKVSIRLVDGLRFHRYIKLYGEKKTDKKDAVSLVKYGMEGLPTRELTESDIRVYWLKWLITEREKLLKERTMIQNFLRQKIEVLYPDMKQYNKTQFWSKVLNYDFAKEKSITGILYAGLLKRDIERIRLINKQLEEVEEDIRDFIETYHREDTEILRSFGFSHITCAYLISVYINVERFPDVKKFKSYMGLGLRVHQSGKKEKNVINTYTNKLVRKLIYMYVIQAIRERSNHKRVKEYFLRIKEREQSTKKAVYKTASKVIEWVYYCLKHKEKFNQNKEDSHETQQANAGKDNSQ
ncbi:MAG: transposase [Archaeoglobaceae archaeon]